LDDWLNTLHSLMLKTMERHNSFVQIGRKLSTHKMSGTRKMSGGRKMSGSRKMSGGRKMSGSRKMSNSKSPAIMDGADTGELTADDLHIDFDRHLTIESPLETSPQSQPSSKINTNFEEEEAPSAESAANKANKAKKKSFFSRSARKNSGNKPIDEV
jgi:hypothetical protein